MTLWLWSAKKTSSHQDLAGQTQLNNVCLVKVLVFCKLLLVSVQLLVALHVALPWPKHVLLVHYLYIYCTMYDVPVPLLVYQAAHIAAHLPVPVPVLAGLPPTTPLECILHRHPCRGRWPWSGAPRQRPPPRPSPPPRGSNTSFATTSCPQSFPLANTVMLKVGLAFVL